MNVTNFQNDGNVKTLRSWRITFWALLIGWVVSAILSMWRVRGGFITSYGSDLLFPPFFYIFIRGLSPWKLREKSLLRWFGRTPCFAAGSIFLVGLSSEAIQGLWPQKFITGTYDPWDIVAYATGLFVCYQIESWQIRSSESRLGA